MDKGAEFEIHLMNNGVSMPIVGFNYYGDRHDSPYIRIDVCWSNGDSEMVHIPLDAFNEVLKTMKWAKANHPAFKRKRKEIVE